MMSLMCFKKMFLLSNYLNINDFNLVYSLNCASDMMLGDSALIMEVRDKILCDCNDFFFPLNENVIWL